MTTIENPLGEERSYPTIRVDLPRAVCACIAGCPLCRMDGDFELYPPSEALKFTITPQNRQIAVSALRQWGKTVLPDAREAFLQRLHNSLTIITDPDLRESIVNETMAGEAWLFLETLADDQQWNELLNRARAGTITIKDWELILRKKEEIAHSAAEERDSVSGGSAT